MSRTALTWLIVIVALVILGVIVFAVNDGNDLTDININDRDNVEDVNQDGDTAERTEGDVSGSVIGDNEITIDEQRVGSAVMVASVSIEAPGYVVIHEPTPTGNPGPVIGVSTLLQAGQSANITVPVSRQLVNEGKYIAMLHIDNGDGTFREADDPVARTSFNNTVTVQFEASANTGNN